MGMVYSLGDALGGTVGAMGRPESVVYEEIRVVRQLHGCCTPFAERERKRERDTYIQIQPECGV